MQAVARTIPERRTVFDAQRCPAGVMPEHWMIKIYQRGVGVSDEQVAALGRTAWIVRIAAIRGEPLDELDNRIAVARLKSDESLQ
jgi:hypothetical protein